MTRLERSSVDRGRTLAHFNVTPDPAFFVTPYDFPAPTYDVIVCLVSLR
jgi:hypothetical protein